MALHRNVRGGKPSPYPRIPFHALRTAQLVGAAIVSAIMIYFMDHLKRDGDYAIPWTFIVLLSVSLATMVALAVTIVVYNFTYLSPRFNLILNGSITLGWLLGLGLLTWNIAGSKVLQTECTAQHFGGEAGAGVCREYKALWGMTFCGTVATILALVLDVITQRKETRLGLYAKPADDQAEQRMRDMKTVSDRNHGYELPDEQGDHHTPAWQAPEQDIAYHSHYGAEEPRGPLDSDRYRDRL